MSWQPLEEARKKFPVGCDYSDELRDLMVRALLENRKYGGGKRFVSPMYISGFLTVLAENLAGAMGLWISNDKSPEKFAEITNGTRWKEAPEPVLKVLVAVKEQLVELGEV